MKQRINSTVWIPLIVALAFVGGFVVNSLMHTSGGRSVTEKKVSNILNLIENEYVDNVDVDSILEATIPSLLANLDPHTIYIPAKDLTLVNEDLDGSFSGVGVSFVITADTIRIVEVISGGPAERVGLLAGDRIIKVDDENLAGVGVTQDDVFNKLRGPEGSEVKVEVKRATSAKPLTYTITRGEIPIKSVDAAYIVSDGIGYIKVGKFGRNTYNEFFESLIHLAANGAEDFVIDLRGNGGGLLEAAVLMVNELLPGGYPIVSTRYRDSRRDEEIISDGRGILSESSVVVLIDEYSASASEIFAGAIQDNDRGLVVGRRSFGKGLVQEQKELPDGSAIRLTVARYYTPSGRCIQKDYGSGMADYENDILDRYDRGEFFEADSMKHDESLIYKTIGGRTVYGGGGIMPDIFVPNDTTGITSYYLNVFNAGLFQRYAMQFVDDNRALYSSVDNLDTLLQMLPSDVTLLRSFVDFCAQNGVRARWHYINNSAQKIVIYLKSLIVRDFLGVEAFYELYNSSDPVVDRAIELINSGSATIVTE